MIKFGVMTGQVQMMEYSALKQVWREAERLGFDSGWLIGHLIPEGSPNILECWTTLSALASVTKTIKLGTLVMVYLHRHPSVLAKMVSTLDVISEGRVILGIGVGHNKEEHAALGIRYPKTPLRIQQLKEALQVFKRMWTMEKANFKGNFYTLKNAETLPKPIQKPHPPIWIGGNMLKITAEYADGWNLPDLPPKEYEEKVAVLKQYCATLGRNPEEITVSWFGTILIANHEKKVRARISKFKQGHAMKEIREMPIDQYIERGIIGTPEQCIEKIDRYIDAGVSYFILRFPDIRELKPMQLFAKKVLPAFH